MKFKATERPSDGAIQIHQRICMFVLQRKQEEQDKKKIIQKQSHDFFLCDTAGIRYSLSFFLPLCFHSAHSFQIIFMYAQQFSGIPWHPHSRMIPPKIYSNSNPPILMSLLFSFWLFSSSHCYGTPYIQLSSVSFSFILDGAPFVQKTR